jgi:hypothetical protein
MPPNASRAFFDPFHGTSFGGQIDRRKRYHLATGTLNLPQGFRGSRFVDVAAHYLSSLTRKQERCGAPLRPAGAGNQCDFSSEPSHVPPCRNESCLFT